MIEETGVVTGVHPQRGGGIMRSVGLAALLLSVLFFLYPWYRQWGPVLDISNNDTRIVGGLLLAVGALTLAVFRQR